MRQAIANLQRASSGAVLALGSIAQNPREKAPARVAAARAILDLAIRAIELEDIDARLRALELTAPQKGDEDEAIS